MERFEAAENFFVEISDETGRFGYVIKYGNVAGEYVDSAAGFQNLDEAKRAAIHMVEYFEKNPEGFVNGDSTGVEAEEEE